LAVSAIVSKVFGLLRDRLLVQYFAEGGQVDLVFAAFRIPDFFFFLLIGGTVSTLFLPRMADLKNEEDQESFFSSFFWLVFIVFGVLSLGGFIFADYLTPLFAGGFKISAQAEVASLARYLFGSVFLLSLSSVLAANLQYRERFLSIAIAPVIYTAIICAGIYIGAEQLDLAVVGWSALAGALVHFGINIFANYLQKQKITFSWLAPVGSWNNFTSDFLLRVGNSAALQVNQSVDILIASFLVVGSVTAFSIGTSLGHVLLSVVGFSVANVIFPKLTQNKGNHTAQRHYLLKGMGFILALTIPFSVAMVFLSKWILAFLYDVSGSMLAMANTVFVWTVISLPFACLIPLFSRTFLANDDVRSPTRYTIISLVFATGLAAYLALQVFTGEQAILGLAIGNFTANVLSALLFGIGLWRKHS